MAAEVLQQLDLAQSALGENLLAENIGNLFDGDTLVCLSIDRSAVIEFLSSAKKKKKLISMMAVGRLQASIAGDMRRQDYAGCKRGQLTRRFRTRPGRVPW
jgi:hypothetical protein